MPDTVTIYWDGNAPMPEVIRQLPKDERTEILTKVIKRREELLHESPAPYIIGMATILIFFLIVAIYPKYKNKRNQKN